MRYAREIEGCFESVFREIGTSDKEWNLIYAHFLTAINIRRFDKWIITLMDEGFTKERAIHRIEKYLHEQNEEHSN